ncbi:MAG: adenylyltransferase/cytidyltransferase family protein [Phycisphaerae bacterium]|nr:adenylyltransferase/cytidyltransferase family protein [Phycisphaerae bacterium]
MRRKPARIIQDHDELRKAIDAEKAAGKTVVLANGGFDLFHVGHVRYLQAAAEEGDVLLVPINSDGSIRGNKGQDRPRVPLAERMEIVAALGCVDYVTSFDSPTVDGLIEMLRPDVHAKGTDWNMRNLPERETLKRLGIRLAVVGDPKNHSTTEILRQLKTKET